MQKINTLLIDDEKGALRTLRGMLIKFCPNINIQAESRTPADAVQKIRQFNPDLLMLDIEMPPFGTSFDIMKQVQDLKFGVILTTAYPQYAIDAINDIQPWAYLIKPFSVVKLQAALEVASKKLNVLKSINKAPFYSELIIKEIVKGNLIINTADIILCQSDGPFVELLIERQNDIEIIRTLKSLKALDLELFGLPFFRAHNSFTINFFYVDRWERTGRNGLIYMKNGMRVPISVQKLPLFEACLREFLILENNLKP